MTEAFSGSYPIESRGGEIERLHIQSAAMVPDTERMLELIGTPAPRLLPRWSLWWLMRTARTCLQGRSISYICAL
jgi:hypothetical protein